MGSPPEDGPGVGASPNRSEVRRRFESVETYGGKVAVSVLGTSLGRSAGRATIWSAARITDGGGESRDTDIGDYSGGGNTLEHAANGPALWAESEQSGRAFCPHRTETFKLRSRRFVTLWVSTSTRRTGHWSCVSTSSEKGTARGRCCPCKRRPMITFGMAVCSRHQDRQRIGRCHKRHRSNSVSSSTIEAPNDLDVPLGLDRFQETALPSTLQDSGLPCL